MRIPYVLRFQPIHFILFALSLSGAGLAVLVGCSEPEPETDPSGRKFLMAATVDGRSWAAVKSETDFPHASRSMADRKPMLIHGGIPGGWGPRSIDITLFNIRGPGRFPLGVSSMVVGGYASMREYPSEGGQYLWETPYTGSAGEVEITEVTDSTVKGTFSFIAEPVSFTPAGPARVITEGRFDLHVLGVIMGLPDNKGSQLTAKFGSYNYSPIGIVGRLQDSTGKEGLFISSESHEHGVDIRLEGVNAPGIYALGASGPARVMTAGKHDGTAGFCCWGADDSDMGEVTIVSFTATRVKGTFHATLKPRDGASAEADLRITEGTFDVGIGF